VGQAKIAGSDDADPQAMSTASHDEPSVSRSCLRGVSAAASSVIQLVW
jgi:hypothetical protein